jgi:uncharacterized protein YcaQ
VSTLGLLQLDFVNVLMPAHFFIPWSRLGAYDRAAFEKYLYRSGECTEQWAHEASIVTADAWSLLAHRREAHAMHKNNPLRRIRNHAAYLEAALLQVESQGPITAHDLPPVPGPKRKPGDWHRSIPRWALEYHFAKGNLAVAKRLPNFQRVYDLPSRVIPRQHLTASLDPRSAQHELLRRASAALGIATLRDLADYFRMPTQAVAPLIDDLIEMGDIQPVEVERWEEQAFLAKGASLPRQIAGASLLSPFDPVVWFRPRALRLFDFHYRIEIYVPAGKRKWGYYVLPFRVGDRIVARVDLKADRKSSKLLVLNVHEEGQIDRKQCIAALGAELQALQRWLCLDTVAVTGHTLITRQLATLLHP